MLFNTTACRNITNGVDPMVGIIASVEIWEALIVILGFGVFACLLAYAFTYVRNKVYHDKDNLDTAFDAGGKVSIGLTASTIVSQWTWAATLLQSSSVASKYGISGSFWYAAGASIQILLFAMLSVQLKVRAPGAKTFLQVIKARFGLRTHIVFCVFALLTNVVVTAMLMLGGAAVLTSLVKDMNVEYATTLVMAVMGAYTLIGGLGATFYVSYFNTAIIYIIMLIFISKVYDDSDSENPLGSIESVYTYVSCSQGPESNAGRSYLTILSNSGLIFGMINIVGNFGTVFVDQSYWQSSVAAKPKEGVWGFLSGGLVWFAVPFSLATTMGLAYTALGARQGRPLLTEAQVDEGLVPCVVAQRLLGREGEILMMFMILMAITSTGSSEIVAVTSIIVYDVYQIHLRPFRHVTDSNGCILCGKARGRMANPRDKCECVSMTYCADCAVDDSLRSSDHKRALKADYRCKIHGRYRTYMCYLGRMKNWCLLWSTLSIFPLTIVLNLMGLKLGWVYLFMGVLIGSAVLPITLSMFWGRMTGYGMMSGAIGGAVSAIIAWLTTASTLDGGLTDFLTNTGNEMPMLCGNLVAILSGGIISVVVSLVTNRHYMPETEGEIWEKTRDIDNPLNPWTEMYARELNLTGVQKIDNRPSLAEVQKTFRNAKLVANVGAITLTFILVIAWPVIMISLYVMDLGDFTSWVYVTQVFAYIATLFIVIMPLVSEAFEIRRAMNEVKPVPTVCNPRSSVLIQTKSDSVKHPKDEPKPRGREVTASSVRLEHETSSCSNALC